MESVQTWQNSPANPYCLPEYFDDIKPLLNSAMTSSNVDILKNAHSYFKNGFNINIALAIGAGAIHYVQRFLEASGNPDTQVKLNIGSKYTTGCTYSYGWGTLLHVAVLCNNIDITRLLIENGANVNAETKDYISWQALSFAVKDCHVEITSLLIANGATLRPIKHYRIPSHNPRYREMVQLLEHEMQYRQQPSKQANDHALLEHAIRNIAIGGATLLKGYADNNPGDESTLYVDWLNKALQTNNATLLNFVLSNFSFDIQTFQDKLAQAAPRYQPDFTYSQEQKLIVARLKSEIAKRQISKPNSNFDNAL